MKLSRYENETENENLKKRMRNTKQIIQKVTSQKFNGRFLKGGVRGWGRSNDLEGVVRHRFARITVNQLLTVSCFSGGPALGGGTPVGGGPPVRDLVGMGWDGIEITV